MPKQENSDVLGGCGKERAMIRAELLRRLRARAGLSPRAGGHFVGAAA